MKMNVPGSLIYSVLFVASTFAQIDIPTNYEEAIRARNRWSVEQDALENVLTSSWDESLLALSHLTNRGISNILQEGLPSADGLSDKCLNATEAFINGLVTGEIWALQMVDAIGKPASSILYDGRFTWLGSYRECRNISVVSTNMSVSFGGEYCLASVPVKLPAGNTSSGGALGGAMPVVFSIGLCFPDVCNDTEVRNLLYAGLDVLSLSVPLNVSSYNFTIQCKNPDRSLDTKATVAIVIIVIFIVLMTAATLFDIYLVHQSNVDTNIIPQSNGVINVGHTAEDPSRDILKVDEYTPLVSGEHGVKVEHHERREDQGKENVQKSPAFCAKLLLSFSVYTNGRKLLSTRQASNALRCVNGVRFLSMSWVILGHTYALAPIGVNIGDMGDFLSILKRWTFQAIINATVSVDSFFVLSGLLVTYLGLKEMKKNDGKFKWVLFYVHRYWRLTPPYMLVMMVYVCVLPYLSEGPIWNEKSDPNCAGYWWTNILYINNFVHSKKMCMAWSWYLANDMQFYIISPLILLPLYKVPVIGYVVLSILTIGSVTVGGVVSSVNHIGPGSFQLIPTTANSTANLNNMPDGWDDLYVRPYTRISAYLVGMLFGYALYKTNCRARMHWSLVLVGWSLAAFFCLSTLYGTYDVWQNHTFSNDVNALYNATFRFAWSLGVGWVIFACVSGYGGPVNRILSWPGIIPLSRLTYCAYLVHPAIMILYYYSQESLVFLSDVNVIYLFFGHMVAAYSVAFVMSLMFESPMLGLEKAVLGMFH